MNITDQPHLDQHIVHQLSTLGGAAVLGFRERPNESVSRSDPLVLLIHKAADALVALDVTATANQHLEPLALKEAVAGAFAAAQVAVAKAKQATTKAANELDASIARFENPAPVNATADLVADQSARLDFRAQPAEVQDRAFELMTSGAESELLAALCRSAMPCVDRTKARSLFKALQHERVPSRQGEFDAESDRISWARGVTDMIQTIFDQSVQWLGPAVLIDSADAARFALAA